MLHACVRKFDVIITVQTFSQTKRSLTRRPNFYGRETNWVPTTLNTRSKRRIKISAFTKWYRHTGFAYHLWSDRSQRSSTRLFAYLWLVTSVSGTCENKQWIWTHCPYAIWISGLRSSWLVAPGICITHLQITLQRYDCCHWKNI